VTPYKEPQASQGGDGYTYFNYCHAHARAKIEQAFGIPKEHWKSLVALSEYDGAVDLSDV
jgi:hypothetical protein